ncbi:MAG: Ppx/GppA family phosphatase [Gammaproteobacteria bacterium]|nr:Ppx/GppA family phosphatase [Gammaproteobacteria bacterium]
MTSLDAAPKQPSNSSTGETFAALDLGSNSFHLLVAREQNGTIQVVDKHREMTRLAAGLEANGFLSQTCIDLSLASLRRIGQRLRGIPPQNVRIVGTNALRQAANRDAFISQAEAILNHNIEIISGSEEGRLIYAAVAQTIESNEKHKLVIDVGGGSTEFILGNRFEPQMTESIHIGCISMSERWFHGGMLTANRMDKAIQDSRRELEVIDQNYRAHGWDVAIGTSGTVIAIQNAIANFSPEGINKQTLKELSQRLICFGHVDQIDPNWCASRRAPTLPGGIAILRGIFSSFKLDALEVSTGALREGLLLELVGRAHNEDIRENSIQDLLPRFHIDEAHAARVAATALTLFDQAFPNLNSDLAAERQLLRWAALLHELGMNISHIAYHKHGAYLLEHLDMPGFSLTEQTQLGWLVRSHRRRVQVGALMPHNRSLNHLCVLLRLAVMFKRNRADDALPKLRLAVRDQACELSIDRDWLNGHPLTRMDLEQEAQYLAEVGLELTVSDTAI